MYAVLGPVVGWIVGREDRALVVDFPDNPGKAVRARSLVALDPTAIDDAIAERREVLLTFERGAADRPIVLGMLHEALPSTAVARVDGERVVLEGKDEIVLQCGRASITLRRNGRVVIRGVDVETRATGSNRIRGGRVAIN